MTLAAAAAPASATQWQARRLLSAPHRLGFALGLLVLAASGLWWAAVQVDRATGWLGLPAALPPTIVHAVLMVFGFMPLFFAGFLFTAGPRWLGVGSPSATRLAPLLLAQAAGWLLWLCGGVLDRRLALAGLLAALVGLGGIALRFLRLVRSSRADDRVHARAVAGALVLGTATLAILAVALAAGRWDLVRALVHTGLWGFVLAVFACVAHRMLPFFSASALDAWRPFWALWLLLGAAGIEAVAPWAEAGAAQPAWLWLRGAAGATAGGTVLVLALAWRLAHRLGTRLMAMLYLGVVWLGIALLLAAADALFALATGMPVLPLASLHALAIGCLGSLMLAMVTRVACGHSGRPVVVDTLLWILFWLLQTAAVLRVAAILLPSSAALLLALAALLWAGVMALWAARLTGWLGCPRADGRPG